VHRVRISSVTSTYSRSGVISTIPCGCGRRDAGVAQQPEHVVLVLHEAADRVERPFVLEAAVADVRPSLYQRSDRRWTDA
jgi:hypothetical protein